MIAPKDNTMQEGALGSQYTPKWKGVPWWHKVQLFDHEGVVKKSCKRTEELEPSQALDQLPHCKALTDQAGGESGTTWLEHLRQPSTLVGLEPQETALWALLVAQRRLTTFYTNYCVGSKKKLWKFVLSFGWFLFQYMLGPTWKQDGTSEGVYPHCITTRYFKRKSGYCVLWICEKSLMNDYKASTEADVLVSFGKQQVRKYFS